MKRRILFAALALVLLPPFRAAAGESVGGWDLDGTSSPRFTGLAYLVGSMQFTPPATSVLTGSINPTASTTLTGVGTRFKTELMVGDKITVSAETRTVTAIASDTSLTVDTATTDTANDTSVDRYPVGLSITGADTSVATDVRIYPAAKSSGNLFDFGVGTTSKLFLSPTQMVATVTIQGTGLISTTTSGDGLKLGTSVDANTSYMKLDTLNADTAGAPASGDCDASAEVGRMTMSTRYTATAEYRLWVCVQTGASTFAWYKSDLTAP